MTWQRRHQVTKDSLTSSLQVTPGADFSLTQWAFTGELKFMQDYIGLRPRFREEALSSPLPAVSDRGLEIAWTAWPT